MESIFLEVIFMKSLKFDTSNWDNMNDAEVLWDYTKSVADYAYCRGARDAAQSEH